MQYRVRDAIETEDEVYRITEICRLVLLESPTYAHMAFDKEKSANCVHGAIVGLPNWFLRVIADESNNVVGGLLCYCEPSLWGPDKLAYDVTLMVDEEHRGRCLPELLQIIREYKEWAIKEGARIIKMGVSSAINIDKADTFFHINGFERIGAMYGLRVGE